MAKYNVSIIKNKFYIVVRKNFKLVNILYVKDIQIEFI